MYPDESSQSLVYCLRSHNMFGCYILFGCEMACDCLMNCFYSSLPYLLVWLSCVWFFSFCDDHQFIDVSRCERFSRLIGKWWLGCLGRLDWILLSGFSFRATTHVLATPLNSRFLLLLIICISFSLSLLRVWIIVRSYFETSWLRYDIILVWRFL